MRVGSVKMRPGSPMIACEPNSAMRVDEGEQRARQDRRRHQRRRDRQRGAQLAGAEDLRRLLVGGVDRLQRARGQQIDERERVQHRHQHQPGHREDVEGEPGQAGDVAHEHVDQPGIGAEQIDERDGGEKRRRQIGQRRGELDQPLAGHVGAAHRPGQQQADHQAEQPGPGAEDQRVLERVDVEPARTAPRSKCSRLRPCSPLHAAEQQRQERQHDQHDQRHDGAAHDHVLEPHRARAAAAARGRDAT